MEPGARVASGHLQPPAAGSGGPERATAAAQPAPPPASCSCAPQQHGRLAQLEAAWPRCSARGTQSKRRASCTCKGNGWELAVAAADIPRMTRRAGRGYASTGASAGSSFVHAGPRLRKPAKASTAAARRGLFNKLPTCRRCPHAPCHASQPRRRQRRCSPGCSHPPRLSTKPAWPRPACGRGLEPAACARLTRPARRQEPAARRSSQRERHLEAAAAAAAAVRPPPDMTRGIVRCTLC